MAQIVAKKFGRFQNRNRIVQRYRCTRCGKTSSESQPLAGVRTDFEQAVKIVHLLTETMGIRAISRFTGCDIATVLNILESAGQHCAALLDARVRNLAVARVEVDEVFSWVGCKPDKVPDGHPERGTFFAFFAIAAKEKLIISHRVAKRDGDEAIALLEDLKSRLSRRIQLTTDGFRGYVAVRGSSGGVRDVFGNNVDYATESKTFTRDPRFTDKRAYFAPKVVSVKRDPRIGMPDMGLATVNHAERTNLTLRTFARRFVRSTINFSKKLENHRHAVAIFVAAFNYCRAHGSLEGKSPAMACGLTDHIWTIEELLSATI
jgi:IS1 family transposase